MICDLMRSEYFTDVSICNAGSFRKNGVIPAGPLSLMVIQESFPFNDPTMVLKMSGEVLMQALQFSVSAYPAEDGRFPQVSGLQFLFNPEKPSHRRIFQTEVYTEDGGYLNPTKLYTVAMPKYIALGGDGYTMF